MPHTCAVRLHCQSGKHQLLNVTRASTTFQLQRAVFTRGKPKAAAPRCSTGRTGCIQNRLKVAKNSVHLSVSCMWCCIGHAVTSSVSSSYSRISMSLQAQHTTHSFVGCFPMHCFGQQPRAARWSDSVHECTTQPTKYISTTATHGVQKGVVGRHIRHGCMVSGCHALFGPNSDCEVEVHLSGVQDRYPLTVGLNLYGAPNLGPGKTK